MPIHPATALGILIGSGVAALAEEPAKVASKVQFIQNEHLKVGIDMTSGGALFWLSEMPDGPNLLNHADRGRFIQQSYYGAPDGSKWVDKDWRWNPVQGGSYKDKPAKILDQRITPAEIYVKSTPIHWATGEILDECRMEEWITIEGKTAHLRFRFEYTGTGTHPPAHQELPAVFIDAAMDQLVYYQGDKPWTGAALHQEVPGWPNQYRDCPEEWAAYIGKDGRGVAMHFPGTRSITCYRFSGPTGPQGSGCSYFAPIDTFAITPGKTHDYRVQLTIGTPAEARERFALLRKKP